MASQVITVEGLASYAKLWEGNMDPGSKAGDEYNHEPSTNLTLTMDQQNAMIVSKANPKAKLNVGDEGLSAKFRRKWTNPTNPSFGGAPIVKDAEGNPWDTNTLIGNGSKVRVAAEVYDTRFGKAMRLMGVQVLELVEYDGPSEPELPF